MKRVWLSFKKVVCFALVVCCLLGSSLTVSASTIEVPSDWVSYLLTAPSEPQWSLVDSEGNVGYHASLDAFWSGDYTLTLLDASEFDRNGDNLVTQADVEYIFNHLDTSCTSEILRGAKNSPDLRRTCYRLLYERFGVSTLSELSCEGLSSAMTFDNFLRNFSYMVCLQALAEGITPSQEYAVSWFSAWFNDSGEDPTAGYYVRYGNFVSLERSLDALQGMSGFPNAPEDNWSNPPVTTTPTEGEIILEDDGKGSTGWLDEYLDNPITDEGVELPDGSDLNYADKKELGTWLSTIALNKHEGLYNALRVARILIGILFIVYAVVFFICYWVDKFNNLIDISLLSLISFGKFIASADDTVSTYKGKEKGAKLLNFRDVTFISLGFLFLGVAILSGLLYKVVIWAISKFGKLS